MGGVSVKSVAEEEGPHAILAPAALSVHRDEQNSDERQDDHVQVEEAH